mgnify:CR=1 FL=1
MDKRFDDIVVPMTNPSGAPVRDLVPGQFCGGRMKGFALVHLVEELAAIDALDAWHATWPEPHRATLKRRNLSPGAWFPVEYYYHGAMFLAQRLGPLPRSAIDVGHRITRRDIGAFFRFLSSMASPPTVLSLASSFWRSYYDRSELHCTQVSDTSALLEIRGWPLLDDIISLHELGGSFVAFNEACRAKDVRLTRLELTRPGHFTYALHWSPLP